MFLAVALAACAPRVEDSATISIRDGELRIEGQIGPKDAERVRRLMRRNFAIVRVNSVGGSEAASIEIARLLRRHENLLLVVDGVCLSACAQYIFATAPGQKIVRSRSLVGCHHNAIAFSHVPDSVYPSPWTPAERRLMRAAESLYSDADVLTGFALVCHLSVAPLCYILCSSGRKCVDSYYDMWAPLASDFERFGVTNVRGAPSSPEEAQHLLKRYGLSGPEKSLGWKVGTLRLITENESVACQ